MAVLVLNASEVDRLQKINTELAPVGWVNELALLLMARVHIRLGNMLTKIAAIG